MLNINIDMGIKFKTCPYCNGTGVVKAMQMATNRKGQTVMWIDTKSKCKHCDGNGVKLCHI